MTKEYTEVEVKNAFSPKSADFSGVYLEGFGMVSALYTLKCNHLKGDGELESGAILHVEVNKLAFKKFARENSGFAKASGAQNYHQVFDAKGERIGAFFVRGNQYFLALDAQKELDWKNLTLCLNMSAQGGLVGLWLVENAEVAEVQEVVEEVVAIHLSAGFWGANASKWESRGLEYDNAPIEIVFEGQTLRAKLQKFNNPTWGKWANLIFDESIDEALLEKLDEFLDINDDCRYLCAQIQGGRVVKLRLDIDEECADYDAWLRRELPVQEVEALEVHEEEREFAYCARLHEGQIALEVGGQDSALFASHRPLEGQDVQGFHFRQGGISWAQQDLDYSRAGVSVCLGGVHARAKLKPTNSPQFYTLEFDPSTSARWMEGVLSVLKVRAMPVRSKVRLFVHDWEVRAGCALHFALDLNRCVEVFEIEAKKLPPPLET
ncbi:hypothetical protein [Helicobacter felis]|uniref:hypothetical protein n=1 Tax=Helicobacter felis TaxID=214 RepID=UPI000CF0C865|nr:hypothetical protein [Helicobacter felis]